MMKRCCCCSLQTGTLIIGCLYTVVALLELLFYCLVVKKWSFVLYVTTAAVSVVHLLSSLLLILAAYKKLPYLTLPWTIVTVIITAIYFIMCLTGMSLVLQDAGDMLGVEAAVVAIISVYFLRACISVYCIVVVHSRHQQLMYENDENRFQHGRVYKFVHTVEIKL